MSGSPCRAKGPYVNTPCNLPEGHGGSHQHIESDIYGEEVDVVATWPAPPDREREPEDDVEVAP